MGPQLIAYIGLVTILTMTPAATTMLVIGSVASYGQRSGFWVIWGGNAGLLVHAAFSALGISVILVRSAAALQIVQLIGAGYIVFLGCRSIWRALWRRPVAPAAQASAPGAMGSKTHRQSFVDGLVTVVLSPEAAMFYLATLPQFIHPGESVWLQSLFLAGIHMVVRLIWFSLLGAFVAKVTAILQRPRVRQGVELSSGLALVLFGARVVVARR